MQNAPMQPPASYAGFWKRFGAYIIDAIIIGILEMIVFIPVLGLLGIGAMTEDFEDPSAGFFVALFGAYVMTILVIFVSGWLYFAIMESTKGATLGKMALGIRVTDMSGSSVSFGRATGRYFAKIVSGLTLGIGYIMAGFTQQKQALHDIISGCLVVNK